MENRIKSLIKKLSRFGFHVRPKSDKHIDPVCGMQPTEGIDLIHENIKYSFCSDHCKEQFEKEPETYITK